MASLEDARAAKTKASRLLVDDERLQGIGITRHEGGYALKVNMLDGEHSLPDEIDGVPLRVEVVGRIGRQEA